MAATTVSITFGWLPRFQLTQRFPFVRRDPLHFWLVPFVWRELRAYTIDVTVDLRRRDGARPN